MPPLDLDGQRICLFGGTFDPIHCAHLRIAEEARRRFDLDRIVFIPAGSPPHKNVVGLTPFVERFRMVEIACEPYPAFEVSKIEDRPRRSYTIDTVRSFKEAAGPEKELFFLIGTDAFDEIETWKNWQELIGEIEFIVVTRPGRSCIVPPGARVHRLEGLELPISSSSIRARLALGEATPELPEAVRAFIEERGLYQTTAWP